MTIDGPAGAGKSTTAKRVAARLGFRYLDSGAMYRAVTVAALDAGTPVDDGAALGKLAHGLRIDLPTDGRVLLDDRDVTREIRTERVTANVSAVSAHPQVRSAMTELQRRVGASTDLVCEGRDMGTVVFPGAAVKIYLDASLETRAERRRAELATAGEAVTQAELVARLRVRDERDSTREHAPLVRMNDQTVVDTTNHTIDEVVEIIVAHAIKHKGSVNGNAGRSEPTARGPSGKDAVSFPKR